jgi:hypothetical protein
VIHGNVIFVAIFSERDIWPSIQTKKEHEMAKRQLQRREWTKQDVRELKTFARAKTPAPKIARALKRSVGATSQKAFALGVSLNSRA